MQFSFYAGIDVSKISLDFAVRDRRKMLFHTTVENNLAGLKQFEVQSTESLIEHLLMILKSLAPNTE